jgi:3-phytase
MRVLSKLNFYTHILLAASFLFGCNSNSGSNHVTSVEEKITPIYTTGKVTHDTDDPAIWINPTDASKSLIIGTDKDSLGGLYVFDLKGQIIDSLVRKNIYRPNNVDVGYGLLMDSISIDFAVTGERLTSKLRFFSLPDMNEINAGGIEIFLGETGTFFRDLMGVAVYKSPKSGKIYVIAGRKSGPKDGSYLWQYELSSAKGKIKLELIRKFGKFSGNKEIEAIAVDSELGFIYYSDEGVGVRKYHAEPDLGNEELALFATTGFTEDHEGISIYKLDDTTGYIIVSDQAAGLFHVFPREGSKINPHDHTLITKLRLSTEESDGSEVTSVSLGHDFPNGLFVAMSNDKTFHIYRWEDLAGDILKSKNN